MPNPDLAQQGRIIGTAINNMGSYSANAAARANDVSIQSQAAQGAFNQASANLANILGDERLAAQYAYNSAGAGNANAFSEYMWDKSTAFNQEMMQKQMEFNAEQAEINRKWQEKMRATAYQTAVTDMKAAGLNPILAATGGGIGGAGSYSGATASTGAASIAPMSGAQASGGLLNGIEASEGNFQGQMEYMGGMLGLISAVFSGFSSAMKGLGSLGDFGEGLGNALASVLKDDGKDFAYAWDKGMDDVRNKPYFGMDLEGIRAVGGEGARIGSERKNFTPYVSWHRK